MRAVVEVRAIQGVFGPLVMESVCGSRQGNSTCCSFCLVVAPVVGYDVLLVVNTWWWKYPNVGDEVIMVQVVMLFVALLWM